MTKITVSHVSGLSPGKDWCLNNLLCFNSQGERLPTDADSLYHQWMKSGGTLTVQVPASAVFIAFASQDVKEVAIAMSHKGGGGWSNKMSCRTVHWSNSQFGECNDWTAESNNDPTQWAYTLVPLAPNSKSTFVGWSQLSKGASSSSDPKYSPVVLDANVVEATVISEQPILEAQLVSDGRAVVAVDTSASSSPPPDRSNPMLAPSFRSSYCSCQSPVNIEGPYSVPPVMLIRGCQSSIKVDTREWVLEQDSTHEIRLGGCGVCCCLCQGNVEVIVHPETKVGVSELGGCQYRTHRDDVRATESQSAGLSAPRNILRLSGCLCQANVREVVVDHGQELSKPKGFFGRLMGR